MIGRIEFAARIGGEDGEPFDVVQRDFVLSIRTLEERLRCIGSAMELQIEFAVPYGQFVGDRNDPIHQFARAHGPRPRQVRPAEPTIESPGDLKHLVRRPASAVAVTERQQRLDSRVLLKVRLLNP